MKLPLVDADEVVRLAARAPLTWYPPLLNWLGGKLVLPEPFGLRHAWADQPWRHRFMADDALRAATPVLRVVHAAAIRVLEENGVDTEKFGNRSSFLSSGGAGPDAAQGGRLRRVSAPPARRARAGWLLRRQRALSASARSRPGAGRAGVRPSARPPRASSACRPGVGAAPCVWPTTGMKLVSPPQRGTMCWCRWAAMPAPATVPWFMPMLKPCAPEAVRSAVIACLVSVGQLGGLRPVEVRVVGDVPVGHDHEVAAVVRVEVEHRVDVLAARDDQAVLVGLRRDRAEGTAVVGARAGRLVLALDVGHPVGRPQALERVLRPHSDLLLRLTRHAVQHMTSPVRGVSPGYADRAGARRSWADGRRQPRAGRWERRTERVLARGARCSSSPRTRCGSWPTTCPRAGSTCACAVTLLTWALFAVDYAVRWRLSGAGPALRPRPLAGHRSCWCCRCCGPLRIVKIYDDVQRRHGQAPALPARAGDRLRGPVGDRCSASPGRSPSTTQEHTAPGRDDP